MTLLWRWLLAYSLTQVVEVPIYLAATRGRSWRRRVWIAVMASTITHPLVWWLGVVIRPHTPYLTYVLIAESFAVTVEALWLRHHGVRQAFWWALTANAASVGVHFNWLWLRAVMDW
jgi:hypothetical protein